MSSETSMPIMSSKATLKCFSTRFYIHALLILFSFRSVLSSESTTTNRFDIRYPIAGGLAGGLANAIIYPIDTLKTLQQTLVKERAVSAVVSSSSVPTHSFASVGRLYSGFWTAVLGAVPSSALYFGFYESTKVYLQRNYGKSSQSGLNGDKCGQIATTRRWRMNRALIHTLAAATGNVASSLVFVPKEAVKQQLQAIKSGRIPWDELAGVAEAGARSTLAASSTIGAGAGAGAASQLGHLSGVDVAGFIMRTQGIWGFFPSYGATLARNIPSAVVRFTVYEELKLLARKVDKKYESIGYLLAGATASALSSTLTTPIDVVKTRLATGVLPPGTGIIPALTRIARSEGPTGLFSGLRERLLWSALFGGIGFSTFEFCKQALGVKIIGSAGSDSGSRGGDRRGACADGNGLRRHSY